MPGFANALYNWGIAMHNLGEFLSAIQDFDVSEINGLNTTKLYMNRAISKSSIGLMDDAMSDLDRAHELDSEDERIWQEKGKILAQSGRLEEAITAYNAAISVNPEYALYYYERSVIYQDMGLIDESRKDLERGNELKN